MSEIKEVLRKATETMFDVTETVATTTANAALYLGSGLWMHDVALALNGTDKKHIHKQIDHYLSEAKDAPSDIKDKDGTPILSLDTHGSVAATGMIAGTTLGLLTLGLFLGGKQPLTTSFGVAAGVTAATNVIVNNVYSAAEVGMYGLRKLYNFAKGGDTGEQAPAPARPEQTLTQAPALTLHPPFSRPGGFQMV